VTGMTAGIEHAMKKTWRNRLVTAPHQRDQRWPCCAASGERRYSRRDEPRLRTRRLDRQRPESSAGLSVRTR